MAKYKELQAFYSSDVWIEFRMITILDRGLICQHCGRRVAKAADLTLHHTPIELTLDNYRDALVALNPANVLVVCHACHNKIHKRNSASKERRVSLVYGAPLAGKKTYVSQAAWAGDLIIDIDAIYVAISGRPMYDKPEILLANVQAVWSQLIDNVRTRYGRWTNAWIIGGYPEKYKREKLAADLGATLIYCETDMAECLRRLETDGGRRERQAEWTKYIKNWFERYSA